MHVLLVLAWIAIGIAVGVAVARGGRRVEAHPTGGPSGRVPRGAPRDPTGQDWNAVLTELGELERRVVGHLLRRERTARDVTAEFEGQLTFGERFADRIAALGGSWGFIGISLAALIAWIAYNAERPAGFDPYPFILLNLVLSCLAALQAPVIMMSQNRMAAKDRLDARHDYEVNLKAEMEIMQLHGKLDELQQRAWTQLIDLQERQLAALERVERGVARVEASEPPSN